MNDLELFNILADKISETHNPNHWGECNEINATIAKFLHYHKFEIECVTGYVKCDNPTTDEMIYDPRHFWITYEGKILDFASQQFKDSFTDDDLNYKMNKPFFYGFCDNYIEVARHPIDNEWIDTNYYDWINPSHIDYIPLND